MLVWQMREFALYLRTTKHISTMGWELIKSVIGSPAGSFAFVFFSLLLIGWLIYMATKYTTKWSMKMEGVDKLEQKIESISSDLLYVKTKLEIFTANTPGGLTASHSPISLTERGKEIAAQMGIDQIIATNWDSIYGYISENATSKNAYDLQQFCIEAATIALDKLIRKEDLDKIKMFAFNSGQNLAYYGSMIGIIIRDKYFAIQGIPIGDIDAHDPNK